MARPTKLTPETQKIIVDAIQLGSTYVLASQAAGIAYNTFNEWMKAGEVAKSGVVREFYESVKKAEGQRVARWLSKIEAAANDGVWTAAAWKLERIYPETYGRQRVEIEHSGNINVSSLSDEELQAIIAAGSGGGA
ncbi:MAG: hypothetical protein O3A51_08475 [Verrucomicrobia bacterium]|nr:hypothetical protein [Verrucomicrobiota bacterium]